MFTGLITDIGEVTARSGGRFQIACGYALDDSAIGASIACDGCCLTVVAVKAGTGRHSSAFCVDVSNETLSKTTLNTWAEGRKVNLERSLTPATELGGHIVSGLVDAVSKVA